MKNLVTFVKNETGLMLIKSDSSGPQPEMPFFSYKMINSKIHITPDVVEHEVFNIVISITCHSNREFEGLHYSEVLAKALRGVQSSAVLTDQGIIVVDTSDIDDRSTYFENGYTSSTGFDLTLEVQDDYEQDLNLISNIEISNKNNTLNIKKED